MMPAKAGSGIRFNERIEGDGETIPGFINHTKVDSPGGGDARSFNVKIFRRSHQDYPPARRPSDRYCERRSSAAAE